MEGIQLNPLAMNTSRSLDPSKVAEGDPKEAATRFEALLATLLVKEMRSTLGDGFFGKGPDGDVYGGWLDQHVGQSLADRDALHIEGVLKESLERKAKSSGELP